MKRTKTKLVSSIVTLLICFAMLIGSTFAWFTDSASTGVNKIQAGNLDIELYHSSTGAPNEQVTTQTELFKIDTWEPGVYVYENLAIKNEGNLALKYTLDFDLVMNFAKNYVVEKNGDVTTGTNRSLADVLYVKISNGVFSGHRPGLTVSDGVVLSHFLESPNNYLDTGALEAGGEKNISVLIYWPESSLDNQYNLKNGWYSSASPNSTADDGENKLFIQFPILLSATQYTSEYDSFGNEYDREPGQVPPFVKPVSTSSAPVNNNSSTELNTDKGSVIIPEGSGLPDNTVAHLEIVEVEEANGNLNVTDGNIVVSYEVELLDQNGNKIDLSSVDQKTILARFEVGYGLNVDSISVYRDGTTQLNVVKYENDYVYFESDHFCDVDVVLPDVVARVGNTYFYNYNEVAEILSAGAFIDGIKDMDSMINAIIEKHGDKFVIECDNENRTITLKASIAKIGTVTYDSLDSAFEASNNDNVIVMVDNGTCGKITIENKNVTLDLNGYVLENSGNDGFYLINSTLTIQDTSENSTGVINHKGAWDLADASNNGKLIIESGTYYTSGRYGILYCGYNGTSGIIGGRFNTSNVACADGYEVELVDGWYIPQRYYMWKDYAAEEFSDIDKTTKTININSAEELALLASNVNNGVTYSGYNVVLTKNIDLAGKRWTPIGKSGKPFSGKFDGKSYTISNLEVLTPGVSDVGLFGFTTNGSIKNVTIENAKVKGYLDVGVVAGTPFTSSYSNITIKGNIFVDGYAYVGGMFGKNLYANADKLTIEANEGSYVKADSEYYRTYVGGIVGFMGEGGHKVSNVVTNINVYGSTCDVGGVTGIAHYNNIFENIQANCNVYITSYNDEGDQLEIGGIAGVWHNQSGTSVKFTNCQFNGEVKATHSNGTEYTGEFNYNGLIGRPYSTSGTGQLIIDGAVQS